MPHFHQLLQLELMLLSLTIATFKTVTGDANKESGNVFKMFNLFYVGPPKESIFLTTISGLVIITHLYLCS